MLGLVGVAEVNILTPYALGIDAEKSARFSFAGSAHLTLESTITPRAISTAVLPMDRPNKRLIA